MLGELIELFKKSYNEQGDALILDNYTLKTGMYIKVNEDGTYDESYEVNKKTNEESLKDSQYKWFAKRDYLSDLLDMNKPIDPKKKIHSNNYMSFFIKKDLLIGKDSLDNIELHERIDDYYNRLSKPEIKYGSKKSSLELYKSIKEPINQKLLDKCRNYIKAHLKDIIKELEEKDFNNYIKIFFNVPIEEYEKESKRYLVPNLYNSNEYNININGNIYGLTNNNMGLNSKKPYLEHKTMVNNIPYLVSSEDILIHKKFFDWLGTRKSGYLYIKDDSDFINGVEEVIRDGQGDYFFFHLAQGKEPEIKEFDYLTNYNRNVRLEVDNFIGGEMKKGEKWVELENERFTTLYQIEGFMDSNLFNGYLKNNYKRDIKDIKLSSKDKNFDQELKNILIVTRDALYAFFKKGDEPSFLRVIRKYGIPLIVNQLRMDNIVKAANSLNFYIAIISQKGGRFDMPGILKNTIEQLRLNINSDDYVDCDNDKQYYLLAGQVVRYLVGLSHSKGSNRDHGVVNPFLRCKKDKKLKNEINQIFEKYSHELTRYKESRVDKALSMLMAYIPENDNVDMELFLSGYLAKNMFYEKKN